jgi:hypothetical protein
MLLANDSVAIGHVIGDPNRIITKVDALRTASAGSQAFVPDFAMIAAREKRLSGVAVTCPEPPSEQELPADLR